MCNLYTAFSPWEKDFLFFLDFFLIPIFISKWAKSDEKLFSEGVIGQWNQKMLWKSFLFFCPLLSEKFPFFRKNIQPCPLWLFVVRLLSKNPLLFRSLQIPKGLYLLPGKISFLYTKIEKRFVISRLALFSLFRSKVWGQNANESC